MDLTNRRNPGALDGTKKRIIRIATGLFSERSYLGVSMNEIAERLGITKPALYYHFPSKLDLYSKVLDEVLGELRVVIARATHAESPETRLLELVKSYLDFGMRERNLVNALVVKLAPEDADLRPRILHSRRNLVDQVEPIVRETIATSSLSGLVDARDLTEMLVALMDGLLVEYSFLDKAVDSKRVANQVLAVLGLHGAPPAGPQE